MHERRLGSSVMVAGSRQEPIILEGLAADLWSVAKRPVSIPEAQKELSNKYEDSSVKFDNAFQDAVEITRPFFKRVIDTDVASMTSQSVDHAGARLPALAFGDSPVKLESSFGWNQNEARTMLAAAQVSIGRPPESSQFEVDAPEGPLPAFRQRVLPGLLAVLSRDQNAPPIPGIDNFVRQNATVQRNAIRCEQVLLHVVKRLSELGIDYRALKGIASSHLDYPEPHLRQFTDIDVLVRPEHHSRLIKELERDGYRHIIGGDPGPFELYKSNYLIAPNGIELDLHHRLFRHGLNHSAVWLEPDHLMIAGHPILTLNRTWRLLHACAHAAFSKGGTRRLSGFLDPVRIAHNEPDVVDSMIDTAGSLQLARLVSSSLVTAHNMLDVVPPTVPRESSGNRDTVALWAFGDDERHVLREQISLLLGLPPRQAIRWTYAWVHPSPEYRGQRPLERLRSSTSSVLRRP